MTSKIEHEYSESFWLAMKNRMKISYYKYGSILEAYPHKLDAIESLKHRLKLYADTGNTEFLVDVANFAMIEFMLPKHKNAHFEAKDESVGRVNLRKEIDTRDNREANSSIGSKTARFR